MCNPSCFRIVLFMVAVLAAAGPAQVAIADDAATIAAAGVIAPADQEAAKPEFSAEVATQAYLDRMSPRERARSDAYFEGGYWLQLWSLVVSLGVAWLLLGSRLSARLRNWVERLTRRKPLQTGLYAAVYLLLTAVIEFPYTLYKDFFREHQYGLANQGFGGWFGDFSTGMLVSLVVMPLLLMAIYGVIRRARRGWWIWGTGVAMIFVMVLFLISPVFIAPLFNTYRPLDEGPLKTAILSMARANGVPADEVYQFDASKQSTRVSANVSGFLGTMRVSLNDNLLNQASPAEIRSVMGHEMGHYVLNHAYEGVMWFSLIIAGGFAFLRWGFDWTLARWGANWGVRGIADVAGLPLIVAVFAVYFFAMTPVVNSIVRANEAEADIFGLNAAREPDAFAEVSLKLASYRKMSPGPVEEFIFFDHPSGRNRILMSMRWKAEHLR